MKNFKVGEEYIRPGFYGPSFWMKVVSRTEDTATFAEVGYEDESESYLTLKIERDTNGSEMCECYNWHGHKGYIRADRRF